MSLNKPIYKFKKFIDTNNINWDYLSKNTNAIPILEKNLNKVDWSSLSKNPNAIPILEKNLNKVDWNNLNYNENGLLLLINHKEKINWIIVSCYSKNISILEENLDKIDIFYLSINIYATSLLKKYKYKLGYFFFNNSVNSKRIKMIETIKEYENINLTWKNPEIFELDYEKMSENNEIMYQELIAEIMKPSRILKKIEEYDNENYDYLEELFG